MSSNISKFHIIKEKTKTKNSVVYLIKNESLDKITILKSIDKNSLLSSPKSYEMLKRERDFYSEKLSSELFPTFINAHKDNNNLYIEMSFIEGVNFSKLLTDEHILKFSDHSKSNYNLYLNFISQIIYMIYILHSNNYCYRDLKLNNLIINKQFQLSLIDFGFVKKLENTNMKTETICGTFHMKAPEIFLATEGKLKEYNPFCYDIYSIGVILYEIYYGKPPFKYYFKTDIDLDEYKKMLYKGIDDSFFDDKIENELKNLIINCMNIDPNKRPLIKDIMEDKLWEKYGGFNKVKQFNDNLTEFNSDEQIKKIFEYIKFEGDFSSDYEYSEEKKKMNDLFADF
jgi:serine/threonine protein kinase